MVLLTESIPSPAIPIVGCTVVKVSVHIDPDHGALFFWGLAGSILGRGRGFDSLGFCFLVFFFCFFLLSFYLLLYFYILVFFGGGDANEDITYCQLVLLLPISPPHPSCCGSTSLQHTA